MKVGLTAKSGWGLASVAAAGLSAVWLVSPALASPKATVQAPTVVSVLSSTTYGSVLVVGGGASSPLDGYPIYEFSGDAAGKFGCSRTKSMGFDATSDEDKLLTCTGPESDIIHNVYTDDWPALTTTGPPVAGPGIKRKLLGSVYRPGIGTQVTYGGHPLYLFDTSSRPFLPEGERYMETVKPFPPWHGFWSLVSSRGGESAPGPATVESETLPDGNTAVAVEMDSNIFQMAVTVYSYSKDRSGFSACSGACAVEWVPVLTTGRPCTAGDVTAKELGAIRRSDGTFQVTYRGKPLYLYSREKGIFPGGGLPPQRSGTAGNGNGLTGAGGGTFSIIYPS